MSNKCKIKFECNAKYQSECSYYTKCDYDDCNKCMDYHKGNCTNEDACMDYINTIVDLIAFAPEKIKPFIIEIANINS